MHALCHHCSLTRSGTTTATRIAAEVDEEKFLAAMVANPNDPTPRLLMADWLEDRDDPRAELVRIQ